MRQMIPTSRARSVPVSPRSTEPDADDEMPAPAPGGRAIRPMGNRAAFLGMLKKRRKARGFVGAAQEGT